MQFVVLILLLVVLIYVFAYRQKQEKNIYKFFVDTSNKAYDKYAPYSYKEIRKKVKDLKQDYTKKQYALQITIFSVGAFVITYLYFYNIMLSFFYAFVAVLMIPYLTYLRCKRIYSEFIFEQIQVYTTNTIMEFATTQSFVKALEGVYESGVLEDPIKSDVEYMIQLAYQNSTIKESLDYMNKKYDFYIVKNMHQLFYQITSEGSQNSADALENMSLDIDMLVEGVYRDRIDRSTFHKKFVQFGIVLYLMVMLVQFLLGVESYINMLSNGYLQALLHAVLIINTLFLLNGEKYYNENVGAE